MKVTEGRILAVVVVLALVAFLVLAAITVPQLLVMM